MKCAYAGRIYDEEEKKLLHQAADEFWLTSGHFVSEFEDKLADFIGENVKVFAVNSGSSANLLAFMALTSQSLGDDRIRRGDEIITIAATFPTTLAPIVQFGAIPVFVDISIPEYNVDVNQLEEAYSKGKTSAVFFPHTLGNPFNVDAVKEFCMKHGLWMIEDCCDALGSSYKLKHVGTEGHLGTLSFYPAHHITTGEGGAVFTSNEELQKLIVKFRDWGRSCTCPTGKDGTCGKRFSGKWGYLPRGYDHKYVYDEFGYNMKMTEMQGAIGVAQMRKLGKFKYIRMLNWTYLLSKLRKFKDLFYLPNIDGGTNPSWFSFLLTIKDKRIDRNKLQQYLEINGIQTRLLFAGNIVRQPCFANLVQGKDYRIIGELRNTDKVMNDGLMVGIYPGLTTKHIDYMAEIIEKFIHERIKK